MKIIVALSILVCLQVSASVSAQKITLTEKDASIEKVIYDLKTQTNYIFFYESGIFKTVPKITLSVVNTDLTTVLDQLLKGSGLTFNIIGKTVAIKKTTEKLSYSQLLSHEIKGMVVDSNGRGIEGATVNVSPNGTNKRFGNSKPVLTMTDPEGKFHLNVHDSGRVLIKISVIGYSEHQEEIEVNGDVYLKIKLYSAVSQLDAVRIIAYGTENRRLSIGATNSVTAKDIENQPIINPLAALEGLVPGLNITPTSGAPGASVQVQVRGQNSISQNIYGNKPYDQPLFIIDGVPVAAQNSNISSLVSIAGSAYFNGYGGISPFNSINPADIESVSILKDASATAIYGTQGANGVIIITTKKGKAGKTKVEALVNTAVNAATKIPQLLNLDQYLSYRREALNNDGFSLSAVSANNFPDLLLFDQNKNTDWVNYYEGKTSNNTNAHVSLSGGSEKTSFIISTGYTNAGYNFPGDFSDNRLTLHSNIHHVTADTRFSIDFGFDYSYERNNSAAAPDITLGILTPPNFPDLFDAAGDIVWNYKGFDKSTYEGYAASLKKANLLQVYNMTNSLNLGYRMAKEFKFDLNIGYSRLNSNEAQKLPASTIDPLYDPSSTAKFSNSTFETINIEPQFNYRHAFGRGIFSALLGETYKKNATSNVLLKGSNYGDEALLGSIGSAGTVQATDSYNPYKYIGVFARLGYIYDDKYIIQVAGRRDGSSNFGPGRQFGNFGSIGLGWIFSQEHFFKDVFPVISYGKLSGTYGTTGTDVTSPYRYQEYFAANVNQSNFQGIQPLFAQNLYNPDYSWDTKKSLNVGLDLGFFKDRILFNVNYYRDRIGNQLTNYTLPTQTGFGSVLQNFNAVVQNQGLELSLTSKNISGKDFTWNTNFNISGNRNKLLSFPGLDQSSYAMSYTLGKSVDIVKGYRLKDVNPQTGIFEFYKADGTTTYSPVYGILSQGGDYQTIANTDPKFIGGIGNTISYKKFSLYFLFQFEDKVQRNYLYSIYSQTAPGGFVNEPTSILSRWTKSGDISSIQRLTSTYSDAYIAAYNFTQSSGSYSNGSYIRLRTASFSYTLPAALCKKVGVADCKFYVNAQNLFLITGFKVGDPELTNLFSFPIQRTIAFGTTINL